MRVVLSTDHNYVFQTCVTIYSAIKNNPKIEYVYVLGSALEAEDEAYFRQTAERLKRNITVICVENNTVCKLLDSDHLTSATFNRLLIDKLLPESIEKILYLDSDIVVRGDITKLYEDTRLNFHTAIVVEGFTSKNRCYIEKTAGHKKCRNVMRCGINAKRKVGIKREGKYFNAGVMLINLLKMRENNIGEKCIAAQKEIQYFDADQGVLNYVLKNDVAYAPSKYNCRPDVYSRKWQRYLQRHAVIFHYSQKPWKRLYVSGGTVWWKYAFELDKDSSMKILKKIITKR